MKNHEIIENMTKYCPSEECSECSILLCDSSIGISYENCTCDECTKTRDILTKYKRAVEEHKWFNVKL